MSDFAAAEMTQTGIDDSSLPTVATSVDVIEARATPVASPARPENVAAPTKTVTPAKRYTMRRNSTNAAAVASDLSAVLNSSASAAASPVTPLQPQQPVLLHVEAPSPAASPAAAGRGSIEFLAALPSAQPAVAASPLSAASPSPAAAAATPKRYSMRRPSVLAAAAAASADAMAPMSLATDPTAAQLGPSAAIAAFAEVPVQPAAVSNAVLETPVRALTPQPPSPALQSSLPPRRPSLANMLSSPDAQASLPGATAAASSISSPSPPQATRRYSMRRPSATSATPPPAAAASSVADAAGAPVNPAKPTPAAAAAALSPSVLLSPSPVALASPSLLSPSPSPSGPITAFASPSAGSSGGFASALSPSGNAAAASEASSVDAVQPFHQPPPSPLPMDAPTEPISAPVTAAPATSTGAGSRRPSLLDQHLPALLPSSRRNSFSANTAPAPMSASKGSDGAGGGGSVDFTTGSIISYRFATPDKFASALPPHHHSNASGAQWSVDSAASGRTTVLPAGAASNSRRNSLTAIPLPPISQRGTPSASRAASPAPAAATPAATTGAAAAANKNQTPDVARIDLTASFRRSDKPSSPRSPDNDAGGFSSPRTPKEGRVAGSSRRRERERERGDKDKPNTPSTNLRTPIHIISPPPGTANANGRIPSSVVMAGNVSGGAPTTGLHSRQGSRSQIPPLNFGAILPPSGTAGGGGGSARPGTSIGGSALAAQLAAGAGDGSFIAAHQSASLLANPWTKWLWRVGCVLVAALLSFGLVYALASPSGGYSRLNPGSDGFLLTAALIYCFGVLCMLSVTVLVWARSSPFDPLTGVLLQIGCSASLLGVAGMIAGQRRGDMISIPGATATLVGLQVAFVGAALSFILLGTWVHSAASRTTAALLALLAQVDPSSLSRDVRTLKAMNAELIQAHTNGGATAKGNGTASARGAPASGGDNAAAPLFTIDASGRPTTSAGATDGRPVTSGTARPGTSGARPGTAAALLLDGAVPSYALGTYDNPNAHVRRDSLPASALPPSSGRRASQGARKTRSSIGSLGPLLLLPQAAQAQSLTTPERGANESGGLFLPPPTNFALQPRRATADASALKIMMAQNVALQAQLQELQQQQQPGSTVRDRD